MQTVNKPLFKALFAVACVLLVLSLLATLVSAAAAALGDRSLYRQQTQSAVYIGSVRAALHDEMETVSLITELPLDALTAAVSDDQLAAMSLEYADRVCDYVTGQTEKFVTVTMPEGIFDAVVADSPEAEELTEELYGVLGAAVMPVGEGHMLTYVRSIVCRVVPLVETIGGLLPMAAALLFVSLVGALLLSLRAPVRLYILSGAAWSASALVAVALWVFGSHPWMERLVLEGSVLKVWITGLYDTVMGVATTFATVLFAVCSVWLLAAILWCLCGKKST